MDKKVYEKTRYPGIKRNIKNKNYIVDICKDGIRTSISTIDGTRGGKKILDISQARKIQQDPAIIKRVSLSINNKTTVNDAWETYLYDCEHNKQLKPRTLRNKTTAYKIYVEKSIGKKKLFEVNEDDILSIKIEIEKRNNKSSAKYTIFKNIKSFFNWLVDREILDKSPAVHIRQFSKDKILHPIWRLPQINKFKEEAKKDFNDSNITVAYKARMIYNLVNLDFALSARIGEIRALQFKKIDFDNCTVEISSNIGENDEIVDTTKTDGSKDILYTPKHVLDELKEYINWCEENIDMEFKENTPLFFNISNKKKLF